MAAPLENPSLIGNTEEKSPSARPDSLNEHERDTTEKDALPPKDGGAGAWLFLFGACVFEIVSWGQSLLELSSLSSTY